jgi:hypothetical protein
MIDVDINTPVSTVGATMAPSSPTSTASSGRGLVECDKIECGKIERVWVNPFNMKAETEYQKA